MLSSYVKDLIQAFDEIFFSISKFVGNEVVYYFYNSYTEEIDLLGFVLILFFAISLFIILLTFISNALRFK